MNPYKTKTKATPTIIVKEKLTDMQIKQKIKELFQEQWLLKRKVLSLGHELRKYKNMLLGLDDLEEQLKKKYGE